MSRVKLWEDVQKLYGVVGITDKECNSYIYKGIKISKCKGEYIIWNTKKRGDFYEEITEDQYKAFEKYGFEYGVYQIKTDNLEGSLNKITEKIQHEISIRNNTRHFNSLKQMRVNVLQRYLDAVKHKQQLIKKNGKH